MGFENAEPVWLCYSKFDPIFGGVYVSEGNNLPLTEIKTRIISGLDIPNSVIRVIGEEKPAYQRIAIATGGGAQSGFIYQLKADAFILGEASHLAHLEAREYGTTLIEVSHHTEQKPLKLWMEDIQKKFSHTEFVFLPEENPLKMIIK